jgi:hypothetical protein
MVRMNSHPRLDEEPPTRESRAYGALFAAIAGLMVVAPLWLVLDRIAPPGEATYIALELLAICSLFGAWRPRVLPDAIGWVVRGLGAPRD